MTTSAHLVTSGTVPTSRPAFCALAIDLELAARPTFTWTPESLRLREWACPCEP